MPQINTSVGEHTVEELKEISEQTGKSFSKVVCEMIELGLKITKMKDKDDSHNVEKNLQELNKKMPEYLLRILATSNDILRCVYNKELSKYNHDSADGETEGIKENVLSYLEGFLNKD